MIFSNTTPFIALSSIQQLDLLPQLFGQIHVVGEVVDECKVGGNIYVPDLQQFAWIKIVQSLPVVHNTILLNLDKGEKHTIDMAKQLGAPKVLIDEKIGRAIAEYMGLQVMGTLGVLLKAKKQGLIPSFRNCTQEMLDHGIRYDLKLIDQLAQTVGEV